MKSAAPTPRPVTKRGRVSREKMVAACLLRMACEECKKPFEAGEPVEWDHHIALALGGENTSDNIRPLHPDCHLNKTARDAAAIAKVERMAGRTGQTARRRAGRLSKLKGRSFLGNRNGPFKKRLDGTVERR